MFIFGNNIWQQVLAGTKTQCRRMHYQWLVPIGRNGLGDEEGITEVIHYHEESDQYGPIKTAWKIGKTEAVLPARYQKAVGRVLVTGLRLERLWDITDADARAEGFEDRAAFEAMWKRINPEHGRFLDEWSNNPYVWVITFQPVQL